MGITWQNWKLHLEAATEISRDAMHIHASLAIFLLACFVFRLRPSDWRVWLIVLAAQLANEALDMVVMLEDSGEIFWWSCVKDTINSMILPTVLVAVARWTSLLDVPAAQESQDPQAETPSSEPPESSG